jgi:predicted ester cyclase
MGIEENKEVVGRIVEETYNTGDLTVMNECTADNFQLHAGGRILGPEFAKQGPTGLRSAFPDLYMKIGHIVAEGDMVAYLFTYQGTHKGEYIGIEPTGKQISIEAAAFTRFVNGKQVEGWSFANPLVLFQQLGVSPPGQ